MLGLLVSQHLSVSKSKKCRESYIRPRPYIHDLGFDDQLADLNLLTHKPMKFHSSVFLVILMLSGLLSWQEVDNNPFLYSLSNMEKARDQGRKGIAPYAKLISELQERADELLSISPPSVLKKKHTPPSGNMHDYYSLGIYWWPDSTKSDGLPYVRDDGVRNPEYAEFDGPKMKKMANAVFTLSLSYFYSEEEKYADKATEIISHWFLDPKTKMNPHLEYGQAIPGIVEGRGIGIIETGSLLKVINAIELLKGSIAVAKMPMHEVRKWFADYNDWLLTSQKGWDERMWHNNHGSSYDSQVATFSMFVGESDVARMILDSVKIKRIDRQIEPDGSQPWELERTKSMSYSLKNLDHLIENAILADKVGIDLWNYTSADGGSIKEAIKFLIPYMMDGQEWKYTQYGGIESKMDSFKEMVWIASLHLDDELIDNTAEKLMTSKGPASDFLLLYPKFR